MNNWNMLALAQTTADSYRLSPAGWLVMILSVGFVTTLLVWCVTKVLTKPGEVEKLHSQADIDPHDAEG